MLMEYTEPHEILQASERVKLRTILLRLVRRRVVNTVAAIIVKWIGEYRIPFTIMDIS